MAQAALKNLPQRVEQLSRQYPGADIEVWAFDEYRLGLKPIIGQREDNVPIPEGLHVEFLPPDSPELQPAERLWSLSDEPLVNRKFESLAELEETLARRWVTLSAMPEVSRLHPFFTGERKAKISATLLFGFHITYKKNAAGCNHSEVVE
jgi:hypothetical protein